MTPLLLTNTDHSVDTTNLTVRVQWTRRIALALFSALLIAGCGGGGGSGATAAPAGFVSGTTTTTSTTVSSTTTTTTSTASLTVTSGVGGRVTSAPSGISCGVSCIATYASGTSVTLTALPDSGYGFDQWSGACSGTSTSCTVNLNVSKAVTASFAPVIPVAAPYIRYTDTLSGPISGGEGNNGAYLSIFGSNFGSSGLGTTTKIYIGGVEVANYRYLGVAKVGAKLGLQQITVQVGALGSPALGTALPVKVVVNGVQSNINNTFTPASGRVLFVSLSGNDSTAVAGDITKPWRYLQNMNTMTGAYFSMTTGDHIVIRGGSWSDSNGVDATWVKFGAGIYARNGTASRWIHFTAYPGPINGNAIEDVHYTTQSGMAGGIQGPWSSIAGTTGEYISVSNLRMDIAGGAQRDAAPINFQFTAGPWRVVNNELGPWVAGNSAVLNAAAVSGHGDGMKVLGNHIHHIAGLSDLQNHGIYADTTAQNWEVAYNWIHDITGGSLVQFNDNGGGAGADTLPHGGIWQGFIGIRIHHNWLENSAKYGVNFNDQNSTQAGAYEARIWDNVIIGTGLPPLRINSTQPSQNLWFAYNTIYNCMTTTSGTGNGFVRNEGWASTSGVVNKFYDNIFMFGPNTVAGTQWFYDVGGTYATTSTYDFKRNLYYTASQSPSLPSTIGDSTALLGNPLFTAAGTNFTTQSGSPARAAATQALPSGFSVIDDFSGNWRGAGTSDVGAFHAP